MLKLAAKHYLKSLGDKCLVPNPDHIEWRNTNCFDIAVKRVPKRFWQRVIYVNEHISLNEILESPLPSDMTPYLKNSESLTSNFSWHSKYNIKGKVGGKIAKLLKLDLSAKDDLSLDLNMEDIMIQSINFSEVYKLLKTKKVNLNSHYIRNLAINKDNIICIVSQYIYLTKKLEIKVGVNWEIEENIGPGQSSLSSNLSYQCDTMKSITFDSGSRLAFDFAECFIHEDGTIELIDRTCKYKEILFLNQRHSYKHKEVIDKIDNATQANLSNTSEKIDQLCHFSKYDCSISKQLLTFALTKKSKLRSFECFLFQYKKKSENGEKTIDISSFNLNIYYPALMLLFSKLGIDIELLNSKIILAIDPVHLEIIHDILLQIYSIYHLDTEHLTNILDILNNCESEILCKLIAFLQEIRKMNCTNNELFEELIQDLRIKFLLLSMGVTNEGAQMTHEFIPTLILLHSSPSSLDL